MGLLSWLRSLKRRDRPTLEERFVVDFDDAGVNVTRPNGRVESVTWQDLQAVVVMTNSDGPFACDVYTVLFGSEGGCVVPMGATGEQELIVRLQALAGFDNDAFIAAMTCAEDRQFVCWKRQKSV